MASSLIRLFLIGEDGPATPFLMGEPPKRGVIGGRAGLDELIPDLKKLHRGPQSRGVDLNSGGGRQRISLDIGRLVLEVGEVSSIGLLPGLLMPLKLSLCPHIGRFGLEGG